MRRVAFRRIHAVLIAAAIALLALVPAAAQTVQDVPPNHWAYEAVVELVRRGYLAVEDGRFNGNQAVDRFTLASVVARLLNEFETSGTAPRSAQDVQLIRELVNEFSEELVAANVKVDEMLARLDRAEKNLAATDQKVSEVLAAFARLEQRAAAIEQRVGDLESTDAQLASEAAQLRQDIDALRASFEATIASVRAEYQSQIEALGQAVRQSLEEQGLELGDLSSQLAEAASALEQEVALLQGTLQDDAARIQRLQEDASVLRNELGSLTQGVQTALGEIYTELNAQAEGLAAQQLTLNELRTRVDALARLETDVANFRQRLDAVEREILAMQSKIGLSEEQIRALSDRVMQEIESQFQHSFLLSSTVAKDVESLKEEFQDYRSQAERRLSAANQARIFGIVGALLGLIALLN